ncbi:hypothetical protein E2C01_076895 [Portunus trituberculatus]|uniref:Uncharacterized protein n=1 Tax=Portunus trituberculatus TaxID=210409 RepID=A0A5B7IEC6_PORTR|nr:hypothetical protein [Portunus trituberculatus]
MVASPSTITIHLPPARHF